MNPASHAASAEGSDATGLPRRYGLLVVALAVALFSGLPFRIGDVYPLCRYRMFSHFDNVQARHVLRGADGVLHNIDAFTRIECRDPEGPLAVEVCGPGERSENYYERRDRYALADRRGAVAQGEELLLLRWSVSFPERDGPLHTESCTLAQCRAER